MLSSWKLVFLCLGLSLLQSWSFMISPSTSHVPRSQGRSIVVLQNSDDHEDTDAPTSEETGIPQLPAIGASSFLSDQQPSASTTSIPVAKSSDKEESSSKGTFVGVVAPKFQIQYTCKVCETRNSHMVSRVGTYMKQNRSYSICCVSSKILIIFFPSHCSFIINF